MSALNIAEPGVESLKIHALQSQNDMRSGFTDPSQPTGRLEIKGIWLEIRCGRDFKAPEMRQLTLAGCFLVLVAALDYLWQHRFERTPELPTLGLADLRPAADLPAGAEWLGSENQPILRLRVDPVHPEVIVHLDLPGLTPMAMLHLWFQVSSKNLIPGKERWQDGRCLIEWHPQSGGSEWENDPFCSVRNNQTCEMSELVLRPERAPAVPALRLENLGVAGDLELVAFEATVLRERELWKIGRWLLMAGWLAWVIAWIAPEGRNRSIRAAISAMVCLLMGIYFVVPGPWKSLRSFGTPFQISGEMINSGITPAPVNNPNQSKKIESSAHPATLKSVGIIPDKGDITLRIKHNIKNARSLLHILLLLAPTLVIACLVGRRSAGSLAMIFALATEAAETAFGYGFDWLDVFDLLCDATGIALALVIHQALKRYSPLVVD